jgi:hypothetical protein
MPSRWLHVANGTSTTTTIEAAGIPGATSIWADPLHDGPVPGGLDDDALTAVRAEHHAPSAAAADPANDMRRWRQVIAEHDAYDELILWFEHDLFDQLSLIQLLSFIRTRVPASKTVSLICIGSFPGRPNFHGLGELRPTELASLLPTRQAVTAAQYELAEQAWRAFREPDPEALDALVGGPEDAGGSEDPRVHALPFLANALRRFLEEYPWTRDGLSRTERRLLALAAEGRADWPASFPRMHEGEEAYYITDTSYAELAEALSMTAPPLLTRSIQSPSLTPDGRDVLNGLADRVVLCGVDRWLGGVHLQGHAVPWRWDDTRGRIRRA